MNQPALQGEALLEGLVALAIQVAQTRSIDAALKVAGEGVEKLGLGMRVVQRVGAQGVLRYAATGHGQKLLGPLNAGMNAAFDAGAPLFIADLEKWLVEVGSNPSVAAAGIEAGFGRMVITPLTVGGKKWGALMLASNGLEERDVPALSLFSAQLTSVLEVAETFERLDVRNKELEAVHAIATAAAPQTSSARLLEIVARATRSDAAGLYRFEPDTGEYSVVGDLWGFEGEVPVAWRRFKQSELRDDELRSKAGTVAELSRKMMRVALNVEGKPSGFLWLSRASDEAYDDADVRTAEVLGVQVSALLERARLNAEGLKRVRQLELLYEMTSASAVVGQVTPVIDRLLTQMLDAIPVDGTAIHFVERTQLRLAGWKLRPSLIQPTPPTCEFMAIDETTVAGRTALHRKATRLSKSEDPGFTSGDAGRLNIQHVMSAPLLVGDRLVGTLTVARHTDAPFTNEEAQLIESCAVHIAVILEHVRLYDDLKVSYDELARTQAELVKHERLAALGELAAVMAHEVRNPLGVIFNSLTSLKRSVRPASDEDVLLKIIGEEADRLNRIVGDLLDFARPYEAQKKPIALEPIIGSAVTAALAAVPNGATRVVVQFPAELPRFQIDGHLVRQAFVNLLVNALQAMPRGGTVTVRALPEEKAGQLWARIEVRDEGDGIPAVAAERIFQPFFTTKATGTGLGLAVVKRIIDAHHGQVTVQARAEGGTTFIVRLPGGFPIEEEPADDDDGEDTLPTVLPLAGA